MSASSSPVRRMLLAPGTNPPSERMRQLDAEAEALQAELEQLRGIRSVGIFPPATDRVRVLRRQLASIELEYAAEFARVNPEWVRYWWGQGDAATRPGAPS